MFELKSFITRINVINILTFANMYVKNNYDKHYKSMFLKKGDKVYLRFHKNYNIFINVFIIIKLE